ncbi:autotransporter outer membrane beta-barrel domain-containing protein [[Haemophilus] felis]|uniref:Autotransporter domain-containing protein n=1 Tax=[Haemophilus] felis TaxID=123822 RepID=A0A1T0B868_9PAST|nr:autotransporter outer membrane beta-barrel domain-containing protein [[Haemophilus] felis]NBI40728.1 autotransporter outer membrane beta-barrel domain-containing protein [[Haemophilus] felis]OOS06226.1 hypothetical protein B0188_02610 [[Haemophilus] felis]
MKPHILLTAFLCGSTTIFNSVYATELPATTTNKEVKISVNTGNVYDALPKVLINLNGYHKEYETTKSGNNYVATLSNDDIIDRKTLLNKQNVLQIIGGLKTFPRTVIFSEKNGEITTTIRANGNAAIARIIENNSKTFIEDYSYLPLVLTNKPIEKVNVGIYVRYEKLDDPIYKDDPDVMKNVPEPRILYPSLWVENQYATSFYIHTPYGYRTYVYGLPAPKEPTEKEKERGVGGREVDLKIEKEGFVLGPDRYGVYTSLFKLPMMVIDSKTGDIKIPQFLNNNSFAIPTGQEVTYLTTDEPTAKEDVIKSGIVYINDNRPTKYKILDPLPDKVLDTPANVKVQLFFEDGSNFTVEVPVLVKEPKVLPVSFDEAHINFLKDRYAVPFILQDTLRKRLGDLREDKNSERGIWAEVKKGAYGLKDDVANGEYTRYQIGYDKKKTIDNQKDRYKGIAYEHLQGDSSSKNIPFKNKLQGNILTAYLTDIYQDGRYLDFVGKIGRVRSHMTEPDSSIWRSNYYSISAEYGKLRNSKNGFYTEPQVQLTYSHLGSASYVSEKGVKVHLDAVNSLILRSGILFGKKDKQTHFYGKVFLNHEFLGNYKGTYLVGGETKTHHANNRGTWLTVGLGLQKHINEDNYIYFDVERDISKNIPKNWTLSVGVRYKF